MAHALTHSDVAGHTPTDLPVFFGRLAALFTTWRQRARARDELARMSDYELRDIGTDRGSVAFEINKPFWRA